MDVLPGKYKPIFLAKIYPIISRYRQVKRSLFDAGLLIPASPPIAVQRP